jgi:apolipoprotein N-acyltransferase
VRLLPPLAGEKACWCRPLSAYTHRVLSLLLSVIAALLLQAAFAPFYQGWLAIPALMLFFEAARRSRTSTFAFLSGFAFGLVYVGGLMIWLRTIPGPAWIALTPLTAIGFGFAGLWAKKATGLSPLGRFAGLVATWLGWLLILRHAPIIATEWPDPGYTVAQWQSARNAASLIGTSGWSTVLALAAAALVSAAWERSTRWLSFGVGCLLLVFGIGMVVDASPQGEAYEVAVVQGNTPCEDGIHCPNEREIITQNHLDLTAQIDGPIDLVVWAESSTGFVTDPAVSQEVATAISEQARRLSAFFLVGSDRPVGQANFTNSNILFNPQGLVAGEYSKQHGVPFGEYVPFRDFFDRWPSIVQISRDMIPGTGPVLLEAGQGKIGSVISYEAAFSRYARGHAKVGADLLVVATNEASYGTGAAADQLIAMSTMRGAENGLDVVHSAITGSSVIISPAGQLTRVTGLFEQDTIRATVHLRKAGPTFYARYGDWLLALVLLILGSILVVETVEQKTSTLT